MCLQQSQQGGPMKVVESQPVQSGILPGFSWEEIVLTGERALPFLHRLLSQKLDDLGFEEARPAFLLDHQGRMVSGGYVYRSSSTEVRIILPPEFSKPMQSELMRYRLREPIEILPSERRFTLWIEPPPELLPEALYRLRVTPSGISLRVEYTGGREILWSGNPQGVPHVSWEWAEAERIVHKIPLLGKEWTEGMIPLEAQRYEWFHPRKGCYVGQEVIERMWSRGRQARILVRFYLSKLPDSLPMALGGGRGLLTSAALHRECGPVGMGYLALRSLTASLSDPTGNLASVWKEDLPVTPALTTPE